MNARRLTGTNGNKALRRLIKDAPTAHLAGAPFCPLGYFYYHYYYCYQVI